MEKEADLKKVRTYPINKRKNKVNVNEFAKVCNSRDQVRKFINSLPNILAGKLLRDLLTDIENAKKAGKPLVWGIGAHVIKVGLGPIIINLMERGYVNAIVMNGASSIHDSEIAFIGQSSEDVANGLPKGTFGMARETGEFWNAAINDTLITKKGAGQSLGEHLLRSNAPFLKYSILAAAARMKIPVTVHIAIGTDIVHMHPSANGEAMGSASHKDFRILCNVVSRMNGAGVYVNLGSAVILPEVFVKALTVARNLGNDVHGFTVAVLDFIRQYRAEQNVVGRPAEMLSGKGIYLIGHHEIMVPLLAAGLGNS